MPYDIAQSVSQGSGRNLYGAQLLPVDGTAPLAGGKVNPAFQPALLREMYNVVPYDRVVQTNDGNYDAFLAALLVSAAPNNAARSLMCRQAILIGAYGFAPITPVAPSPPGLGGEAGGHYCGQVDVNALRAYGPATF
jgi:hypothetical protein